MTLKINYDISSYITALQQRQPIKVLKKISKGITFDLVLKLNQKLKLLNLSEAGSHCCAMANFNYHFPEIASNSIDALVSKWQKDKSNTNLLDDFCDEIELKIQIDIQEINKQLVITYNDYAGGFSELNAKQCLNYMESSYFKKAVSDKTNDDSQIGGCNKGLRLLSYNLDVAGGSLLIANNIEGGACLTLSSNLDKYSLPVRSRSSSLKENDHQQSVTLTLPHGLFNKIKIAPEADKEKSSLVSPRLS